MSEQPPVLDLDPFSREFLLDPYPFHEQIREAGPVVYLQRYGIWGLARYEQVHATLNRWQLFCSSAGVGLADFRKQTPWRRPSLLLENDPPAHTPFRTAITTVLSRRALAALRPAFQQEATRLVTSLLERGTFDAMKDLAQAFPLKVFPDAVGLDASGREHLLTYGDLTFNAFGPRNNLVETSMRHLESVSAWIASRCRREALNPGGLGAQLYGEADAGRVTEEEAALLVRSLLTAGVDTTVYALSAALVCLVRNRDQWQLLRNDPARARAAFDEAIRLESPVQTFFRTTAEDTQLGSIPIPGGSKILMFLGAANRDPRRWVDPDRYDLSRNTSGHVGFGAGLHTCVGQMIARLEAEVLLSELARRVESFDPLDEPVPHLNNTLRGWEHWQVRVRAAPEAA